MPLNSVEVKKIFELAKLTGSDEFIQHITSDLDRLFSLVANINNIDTTGVEPFTHPYGAIQRLREDECDLNIDREKLQKIAPATEAGLYLVPAVIE